LSQDANIPVFYRLAVAALARAYAMADRAPDALALLEQMGEMDYLNLNVPFNCGEAYLRAGCVEDAHRLAQRMLADAREHKMRGWEGWALWLLGDVALHGDAPDVAQAATLYQQALALAEELGMRPLQAHCHHGLGRLYAKTGQQEQARTTLATAIELYRAMEMTFWLPEAEAVLTQVA
jgi:tetratricopeptide (TPR) repeat protein